MAGKIPGNRTLAGTHAEVWINGVLCYECNKIEAKVSVEREDVKLSLDVDSKIVGLKGEGTLTIVKVYSRFEEIRKSYFKGEDVRSEIITKLADPDAYGKQVERYSIANVWFNELPLVGWEKGAAVNEEYSFGFTPTDMQLLDRIEMN